MVRGPRDLSHSNRQMISAHVLNSLVSMTLVLSVSQISFVTMPTNSRISVVGDWTACQLEWLEDQEESYLEAYTEEQISFFPDLYHRYFALWPVRRTLWPSRPSSHRLSRTQRKRVYEAEDYCKTVRFTCDWTLNPLITISVHQRIL